MTIPIPACTEQEPGVLETSLRARCGAGVGVELADAVFELECENGKLIALPPLALDLPLGEAP